MPYENHLSGDGKNATTTSYPADDRIVIPKIFLNEAITGGASKDALDKGVWLSPNNTPSDPGLSVIAGHRFNYRQKGVFYHLDKLETGDEFVVYWKGQEYVYSVANIQTVAPNDQNILRQRDKNMIILYTCTPVWTNHLRLIVTAELKHVFTEEEL